MASVVVLDASALIALYDSQDKHKNAIMPIVHFSSTMLFYNFNAILVVMHHLDPQVALYVQ